MKNQIVEKISTEHEAAAGGLRIKLIHAINCGELLAQAKADLPPEEWSKWLTDNCHFSNRLVQLYMHLAESHLELEKAATIEKLTQHEPAINRTLKELGNMGYSKAMMEEILWQEVSDICDHAS
jgi:hypothetical protein